MTAPAQSFTGFVAESPIMTPTWLQRLEATLRRPTRITVARYLAARSTGELAVEDEFFWQLQLASGVFKATNRRRFDDTFEVMRAAVASRESLRVLDVACSSGVSTVELHRALARPGLTLETRGTDIVTRVMHATVDGGALVYDLDGNVLGAELDDMLVNTRPNRAMRWHHPWVVHRARGLFARFPARGFTAPPGSTVTEVPLVSSTVAQTSGVEIAEEDLLRPQVAGRFGLIRAANILNRGYFAEPALRACVAALLERLEPDGLLFVVRTERTVNHGTLWARDRSGVAVAGTVGLGCEIAALVEDVARNRPSQGAARGS